MNKSILVSTSAQSQWRPDRFPAQKPSKLHLTWNRSAWNAQTYHFWCLTLCRCVTSFCCEATFYRAHVSEILKKNKTKKKKQTKRTGAAGTFPLWWLSNLRRLWRWTEKLAEGLTRSRPWTAWTRAVGGGGGLLFRFFFFGSAMERFLTSKGNNGGDRRVLWVTCCSHPVIWLFFLLLLLFLPSLCFSQVLKRTQVSFELVCIFIFLFFFWIYPSWRECLSRSLTSSRCPKRKHWPGSKHYTQTVSVISSMFAQFFFFPLDINTIKAS